MKRLVAKRRLKRKCQLCGKSFKKGEVYYRQRIVLVVDGKVHASNVYQCPKCRYKYEQHKIRFKKFKKKCTHPDEFIDTEYRYIPGECVKEPDYDYCRLCGQKIF